MGRPLNLHRYGGDTSKVGKQLQARAKITTTNRVASLMQQKNQYSFKVKDTADEIGICKLVDKANAALLPGEMTLTATTLAATSFRIKRITNKFCWNFANVRFLWAFDPISGKVIVDNDVPPLVL